MAMIGKPTGVVDTGRLSLAVRDFNVTIVPDNSGDYEFLAIVTNAPRQAITSPRVGETTGKAAGRRATYALSLLSMFEITGTVKKIFEEQTFGSGFNKREFVLTIESGRFPQDIKFECVKDKVGLVAGLKPGTKVKVFFDLRGREYKDNYYVNLNAWKLEVVGATPAAPPADDDGAPLPEPPGETVDEDVPF
jgi:hypothetical protein